MKNKVLLLSAAVVAVGLFALPSTLSMFAGQHSWYDPKDNGIPCAKCHFLEKEELAASGGPHDPGYDGVLNMSAIYNVSGGTGTVGGAAFWGGTNSVNDRCFGCHQTAGSKESGGSVPLGSWGSHNDSVHAAYAVLCIDCHTWVDDELTNDSAAHRWFYEDLKNDTGAQNLALQNENRACLGCHTHVGVNLTWTRNEFVSYNVTCDGSGYNVAWNESDDLGTNTSRFNSSSGWDW